MKTTPYILLLLHIVVIQSANSQWTKTNGPGVDRIFSIASNGTNIFAGSYGGGVFISSDDGVHWSCPNTGLNDLEVYSIYVSTDDTTKTKVYVVTNKGSIYFSEDTAKTWIDISSNLDRTRSAYSVVAIDTNLFIGKEAQGIFRSTDNGSHWSQMLAEKYVYDLKIKKKQNAVSVLFACTDVGIYSSTDLGSSWHQISPRFHSYSLAFGDSSFYAGTEYGLYSSTDNGVTWNLVKTGVPTDVWIPSVYAIKDQLENYTFFAGSYGKGIFVSHNNGNNWDEINLGLDYKYVKSIFAKENDQGNIKVYAGTDAGMYVSRNGGSAWEFAGNQLTSTTTYALQVNNYGLLAATDRNVFISTDKGNYWSACKIDLLSLGDIPIVKSLCSATNKNGDSIYFAGTDNLGIFISTDKGYSWTNTKINLSHITAITSIPNVNPSGSERIIIGTTGGLFYASSDNTMAQQCNPTYPIKALISILNPSGGYELFAGTNSNGIYSSTDNGLTWWPKNTGIVSLNVTCLGSIPDNSGDIIIFAGAGVAGLYYSINHGTQWKKIQDPSLRRTPTTIKPFRTQNGLLHLAVGTNQGLSLYQLNDTSWVKINSELPESYICSIEVIDSTLFAGIYHNGVWATTIANIMTSVPRKNHGTLNFLLDQNYPNPFNSSTIINYTLPFSGNVRLEVYDLIGRKIIELLDENQKAGTHAVNFNASALSSGIYFYRLRFARFTETKNLLLIK